MVQVPYNRIASRILAVCDGQTYQRVYEELLTLLKVFGNDKLNKRLDSLTQLADPTASPYNFNEWFNFVFEAIVSPLQPSCEYRAAEAD